MSRLARFTNNATSRLAGNLSAAGLTLTVTPGDGAKFPILTAGQYFTATLVKADGTKEIIKVTARSTDTFTIVRAYESAGGVQTAFAFSAGDKVELRLTGGAIGDELDRLDRAAYTRAATKSANYAVLEADISTLIRVDTSGGARTITLPLISTLTDAFEIVVTKITADTNLVNVTPSGGDTINGGSAYSLSSAYQSAWVIADRSTNTWTAINSGTGGAAPVIDAFVGAGTAGPFTLSGDPISKNNTAVYVGGVYQQKSSYTLAGTALTLGGTVAAGVPVEVAWNRPVALGSTTDDLVVTAPSGGLWTTVRGFIAAVVALTGSTVVGFIQAGVGAVIRTVQDKLRESFSVADFGAVGDGVTNDTAAVQAAITYCAVNGKRLEFKPTGTYLVSSLSTSYNSLSRTFVIDLCGSTIKSNGASASPLIELLNARCVKITNGVLDGSWSLTQSRLIKHWANAGASASYCIFNKLSFRNAQFGFQLGDISRPDEPYVSENTMSDCDFIGVLNPVIAYGVQGEINIVGTKCTSSIEGWTVFPGSYTLNGVTSVGANVRMTGGQINSYGGNGVSVQPIASVPSGNLYGKVFCTGTWFETQDRMAVAENPAAVATPVGGVMSFVGCPGAVALNDTLACIDAAASYTGEIVVQGCYFFSSVTRTKPNINAPAGATVRVDSKSFNPWIGTNPAFGAGFITGAAGFSGGKLFYDSVAQTSAVRVLQSVAHSIPNATWTKLQLQNEDFDTNSEFDAASTYRFTPKQPGYYQVNGQVQVAASNVPAGIDIYKNGASTGSVIGGFQSGALNGSASISRLLYMNGTTDYLELYGYQGSGGAVNSVATVTQLSVSYVRAA